MNQASLRAKAETLRKLHDKPNILVLPNVWDMASACLVEQAGYPALGNVHEWYGVIAPAATPRDTIAKLNAAIVRALGSPDVLNRIQALGQYPAPSTPAEFAEYIRADYERWGKVVKASGAKMD